VLVVLVFVLVLGSVLVLALLLVRMRVCGVHARAQTVFFLVFVCFIWLWFWSVSFRSSRSRLSCLVRRTHAYGYEVGASIRSESADNAELYSLSKIAVASALASTASPRRTRRRFLVALAASIRPSLFRTLYGGQVPRFRLLGRYRRIHAFRGRHTEGTFCASEPSEPSALSDSTNPPTIPV
jgi:hypothetical protein